MQPRSPLVRVSCFRELINVRQFCVVQDRTDSLQGIRLPDPLQLHLRGTDTHSERLQTLHRHTTFPRDGKLSLAKKREV